MLKNFLREFRDILEKLKLYLENLRKAWEIFRKFK